MISLDIDNIKTEYDDKKEFQNIAKTIRKSRKCIVVTGAGISVSGGIPDFRSSDGLYNLVKNKFPQAVVKGKDLFDATLFRDPVTTKVFYTFMGELKEILNKAKITPTHRFVKDLDNQGKLLRCYTQNIDSLERRLKLSTDITDKKNAKIVQLHGDMDRVVCTLCQETFEFTNEHKKIFKEGNSVPCPSCQSKSTIRELTGKRAIAVGSLRPNIVLYNEHHINGDLINDFASYDISKKPDLLIVIGTSLKVYGIKNLVKRLANVVHSRKNGKVIFINKTELCSKSWGDVFDYEIISTSDEAVTLLKKEINYLDTQEAIKKEMTIKKEKLKEELKAKGIKYNPRIHKFNEITPDQTILKIEDKTGNLVVHIPYKPVKIESEDESSSSGSGDDKMLMSSSPTLSVSSIFSTTSTLSSLSDLTEFEDIMNEDQIILDNIDNEQNLQEILAQGGNELENNKLNDTLLHPINITEQRIALEKLSVNESSLENESQQHQQQQQQQQQEEEDLEMNNEFEDQNMLSENEISTSDKKVSVQIVNNKIKLNLGKNKMNTQKKNTSKVRVIKSIKLKLKPSNASEEKENNNNYMDIDNQNQQDNSEISDVKPVSRKPRSRSNSIESIEKPVKIKNVSPTSVKKEEKGKAKSKSTKRTNSKKNSHSDNLRNILKVGKRNVAPVPTAKKNRVKRNSSERNVLDEKSVNHLHIIKKIKTN